MFSRYKDKFTYKTYGYRWFSKLSDATKEEINRFTEEINKLEAQYRCSYTVFNIYHDNVRFYPFWNEPNQLQIIHPNDWKDLQKLESKDVTLPVKIDKINQRKGYGIRASRNIFEKELVAVYSGVVMSSVHSQKANALKDYCLAAFDGPGVQ